MTKLTKYLLPSLVACLTICLNCQIGYSKPQTPLSSSENIQKPQGVCNFSKVTKNIWRGAYPKNESCYKDLSKMGVKTIVNLRMPGLAEKQESFFAKKYGINYFHVPFGYLKPNDEKVSKVLALITNKENQPVFVHCMQGADRTGMIIGLYRTVFQNWTFDRTYKEMKAHHFKPWLVGLRGKVKESSSNKLLTALKIQVQNQANKSKNTALAGISSPELAM